MHVSFSRQAIEYETCPGRQGILQFYGHTSAPRGEQKLSDCSHAMQQHNATLPVGTLPDRQIAIDIVSRTISPWTQMYEFFLVPQVETIYAFPS
jgi:hypothetical protein